MAILRNNAGKMGNPMTKIHYYWDQKTIFLLWLAEKKILGA